MHRNHPFQEIAKLMQISRIIVFEEEVSKLFRNFNTLTIVSSTDFF
ncbi:hypothetical protein LEP1GSC058_3394 [Leptospira fainei serovar Hurstbridge str. BUT 6]|uniref:Uncharacterized protein n=1 Tax=Leptospira fainei serovar Hurstbridge str. BUT 6 TaxID=1193011 RepID=S3VXI8_9LEPT|nr:hypothetical protein LEP1GSC058_3394 [Leptospira fainei serovar Hurstbridge str. BUT 6]